MIHPTAVVHRAASLADDVEVNAYAVIGARVEIDAGSRVGSHAIIEGPTKIGRANNIGAHSYLGGAPQDTSYRGEATVLELGHENTVREFVTMNRASTKEQGITRVGNNNYFMAYSHVAHDCRVGDHCVFANNATLGGHVHIGNYATLGGLAAVHQFVRIGDYAMLGAGSIAAQDIPPFMLANGQRARLNGLNSRGLRRNNISKEALAALKKAYRLLYRSNLSLAQACELLEQEAKKIPELNQLVSFLRSSRRGICREVSS